MWGEVRGSEEKCGERCGKVRWGRGEMREIWGEVWGFEEVWGAVGSVLRCGGDVERFGGMEKRGRGVGRGVKN